MSKVTKYHKTLKEKVDCAQSYPLSEAISIVQSFAQAKFKESVDAAINLGIDPKKSDQNVRGMIELPHGSGKVVRVAVFAQGDKAEEAKKAGADRVGFDDLLEEMKAGAMDYDIVIATPDSMRIVGSIGPQLGPRGLMPNPKMGTITPNVASAVEKAKAGQARYKSDRGGVIHCSIGRIDFSKEALVGNLKALLAALVKAKPSTAKGIYLRKITLSSTMGPGIQVDVLSC